MSETNKANILEKAARIAVLAHGGKTRKGDGLPYIIHPVMVALKMAKQSFSDTVVASALVHDVLEDTKYPEEKLRRNSVLTYCRSLKPLPMTIPCPGKKRKGDMSKPSETDPTERRRLPRGIKSIISKVCLLLTPSKGPGFGKSSTGAKSKKSGLKMKS